MTDRIASDRIALVTGASRGLGFAMAEDLATRGWHVVAVARTVGGLEELDDRVKEKRFVENLGGRPAPYAPVDSADDLARAIERIGTPGVLKTARDGYDGKGQWRIASVRWLKRKQK